MVRVIDQHYDVLSFILLLSPS